MLKRVQSAGQFLFLRLEHLFNAVFGDRVNPLYHLGSISYVLFWVVIASGFYIYAFYETGVDKTYASVEALTHQQRWLGGIMRSLHRYASIAMILSMLLHMFRHFLFGRYRGFRAFSWITGVVLLWLVYASGINGYMLPWDRLAQFVVIATAELFDALPVFRGSLVRNFITPEGITDRLFSLLSFLHIGIPLAVLALLTVHTQRVPRAQIIPPLALTAGILASITMLAVVQPVLSQGAADFSSFPQTLHLDWVTLAIYPLIYEWSPLAVWILLAGSTLVLLGLPWLPPRRGNGVDAHIMVHPDERTIGIRPGESILDACLRANLAMPFQCRSGACGVCKATLLAGDISQGLFQAEALSDADREARRFLACCATALGDIEIEYGETSLSRAGVRQATVETMRRLAPDVMLLVLRPDHGEIIDFKAGQFINIVLEGGERRAYSFATAPNGEPLIELHIRRQPGGLFTTRVFNTVQPGDSLFFEGPLGQSPVIDNDRLLILVAASTGFAPVKSVLEHAFARGFRRRMSFYWGVRRPHDLYLVDLIERWQSEHAGFRYIPVVSDALPEDGWLGRTGLVHEAILADYPDLSGCEVYACGSVSMVQAARPAFLSHGLDEGACFSDAFLPAASGRV
jgi:NAD(P)H-flavin reductase/ferredoxin